MPVNAFAATLAFAPALALGSFLNVLAARLPAGRSVVRPGSACLACEAPIAWYDNVPVLSYLLLRGRCRACGSTIGWKYPAVELTTAVLVAACFLHFGATPRAAIAAIFCAALVTITVTDLERRIIPNRVVLPAAAIVLAGQTLIDPSPEWALAGFGAALFLLLAALAYPGGMGMGDVKLALLLGFALGREVPLALLAGMLAAMVPSLWLIARHGRAARRMGIPLGPFLALGSLVALFAGERLVDAYLSTF